MPHPDAQVWNARYLSDDNHYLRRQPYSLVEGIMPINSLREAWRSRWQPVRLRLGLYPGQAGSAA